MIRRRARVSVVAGLTSLALAAAMSVSIATPPAHADALPTTRIAGADRFATAVEIAKAGFPTTAPVVFLATGLNYPDALAAGPVAAKLGGPLLLTLPDQLPVSVRDELVSLAPATVYLVGGTGAVSTAVQNAVHSALPAAAIGERPEQTVTRRRKRWCAPVISLRPRRTSPPARTIRTR